MGMAPKLQKKKTFLVKTCNRCGGSFGPESYTVTKSYFYTDGFLPICNDCIEKYLIDRNFGWDAVDKICQYADIPFVPAEFERLHEINGSKVFPIYAQVFLSSEFDGLGWGDYFKEFTRLKESGDIDAELPIIGDAKRKELLEKWGPGYDDEAIHYMEDLLNGMLLTQNISGKLQFDQAKKICKISYELDSRLREGSDFDKLLTSYDKLVKVAEFTPKNTKNANDFDSTGELFKWLEKGGWKNKFYDGVTRDVVDETMKNIQNWNQRLYTNENGIGEEITKRLESLKNIAELESYYDTNKEYDLDEFENDGYNALMKDEEFAVDLEDDDDE